MSSRYDAELVVTWRCKPFNLDTVLLSRPVALGDSMLFTKSVARSLGKYNKADVLCQI